MTPLPFRVKVRILFFVCGAAELGPLGSTFICFILGTASKDGVTAFGNCHLCPPFFVRSFLDLDQAAFVVDLVRDENPSLA